jgi:fluoride exporter
MVGYPRGVPDVDRPLVDVGLVAAGGALGSLARWGVGDLLPGAWATLAANVSGCFVLGLLSGWVLVHHPALRRFAGIGVLGGYTTFSTHLLDGRGLADGGSIAPLAYVVATLATCVAVAALGLVLGHRLERR